MLILITLIYLLLSVVKIFFGKSGSVCKLYVFKVDIRITFVLMLVILFLRYPQIIIQ